MKFEFKQYKESGIPILTHAAIEKIAYTLLSEYDGSSLISYCRPPVAAMLEYLQKKYDLKISFLDLGKINDRKIVGRTIFSQNLICIDESLLDEDSLFLFTGTHEIGHWVLHRSRPIKAEEAKEALTQSDDCQVDFSGKKKLVTVRDWMEHQANVFAAAFLMPEQAFRQAVIDTQRQMGITRNVGKIILTRGQSSQKTFLDTVMDLQKIFGTSLISIKIRLKTLGILQEDSNRRLVHISEIRYF